MSTYAKSRREKLKAELKQEILAAARETFARIGYENLSMRGLAQELLCSPGTLYLYFQDKDDLLRSVVEDAFAELHRCLLAIPTNDDPIKTLKRAGWAYIEFGLREPSAYKCAFVLGPATQRNYRPHPAYDVLRGHIKSCIEAGRLRDSDVDTNSQILWACLHGLTSLFIARPSFPWIEQKKLIGQLIDTAVGGLLKTPFSNRGARDGNNRKGDSRRTHK